MTEAVFFVGTNELATLTNTFKVSGVATDPTAVSLAVTDPTGAITTYTYALAEITRTSAGLYTKDVACSIAGEWSYVWTGTGTASDVVAGTWTVTETEVGRLYATVPMLKSRLGGINDALDDFELHAACFAASRVIEQYCQRTFWRTAAATVRTLEVTDLWRVCTPAFHDIVSVSALATDSTGDGVYETSWSSTDYQLYPTETFGPETRPYTEIRAIAGRCFPAPYAPGRLDRVQVTGVWGWPAVPWSIRQATLILAQDIFSLKGAKFGVAAWNDFGPMRVGDNRAVRMLADPYRRNPVRVM